MTKEIYASDARTTANKNIERLSEEFINEIWKAIAKQIEKGGFFLTIICKDDIPEFAQSSFTIMPDAPCARTWYRILSTYFKKYDYKVNFSTSIYTDYPKIVISWK